MVDATVYDPDNDPVSGSGTHHTAVTTTYDPAKDPGVGTQTPPPPPPTGSQGGGYLSKAWNIVTGDQAPKWLQDVEAPAAPSSSGPIVEAGLAGVGHGIKEGIDYGAERLAGWFAGPDTRARIAAADQATAQQARQNYAANPQAFETGATLGKGADATLATIAALGPVAAGLGLGGAALGGTTGTVLEGAGDVLAGTAAANRTGIPGLALRTAARVPQGAVGGAVGSAATGDDALRGAATGAVLGPLAGLPMEALTGLTRGLTGGRMTPLSGTSALPDVTRENAANADYLLSRNIPVSATQVSTDPSLQAVNKAPFAVGRTADQLQAVRREAMSEVGETNSTLATGPVMRANADRIGQQFDNTIGSVQSIPAAGIGTDLQQIFSAVPTTLSQAEQQAIRNGVGTVATAFRGGSLTGAGYQDLMRRGTGALEPLLNSDNPTVRAFGLQLRDAVDQRLQGVLTPAQLADFQQARGQYRALKTVELATKDSPNGDFTPAQLHEAARAQSELFDPGNTGLPYGGGGNLGRLGRAADAVITPSLSGETGGGPSYGTRVGQAAGLLSGGGGVTAAAHLAAGMGMLPAAGLGLLGVPAAYGIGRGIQAANWAEPVVRRAIATATGGANPSAPNLTAALQGLIQTANAYNQRKQADSQSP